MPFTAYIYKGIVNSLHRPHRIQLGGDSDSISGGSDIDEKTNQHNQKREYAAQTPFFMGGNAEEKQCQQNHGRKQSGNIIGSADDKGQKTAAQKVKFSF